MTIFYRGPHLRITDQVLDVRYPWPRRFAVRDLSELCVIEQEQSLPAIGIIRAGSTGIAAAGTAALAVAATGGWPVFQTPVAAAAMIMLLIASVVVAAACWRLKITEYELTACYRGQPVRLYRSTDFRAFDQVKRGLLRALEQVADT